MNPLKGKNPFRPGVGTRPLHLAGRDAPIRRFLAILRSAPEQPANVRLTGLRGVGKTVLLGEFSERATELGWEAPVLELEPSHNTDDALRSGVVELLDRVQQGLSRIERLKAAVGTAARTAPGLTLSWGDVAVSLRAAEPGEADLARSLFETVDLAIAKGRQGLVLLLDEAQAIRDDRDRDGEHPLSMLISAVSALQRMEIPLGLVVCGLPTLTGNLLRARSYTERMFRGEEIGSLDPIDAGQALAEPLSGTDVVVEAGLVEEVVREVEGYPYFIQLWGAELWDAAVAAETTDLTTKLLAATRPDIYRRLDIDFYEPRVATLTPAEQDLLLGTAACPYPPLNVGDLNEAIDKSPGNINVLLGRLVEHGVLYRIRKGQYEYTAPKFRQYLERRAPLGK